MSWTTPKTWASGDILTASDMNTYVRDNTDYTMNTAMKKLLSTTASYSSTLTVGGSEVTVTTLSISDPTFPSTSYAYVPFGAFNGLPTESGDTCTFQIRDNGTSATVIAKEQFKTTALNAIFMMALVGTPTTVSSGARTAYFRSVVTGGGTVDFNNGGLTTYLGAILAPI